MSVLLERGHRLKLETADHALFSHIALTSDVIPSDGAGLEYEAACALLDGSRHVVDIVHSQRLHTKDGCVRHGAGDGAPGRVNICLSCVPASVQHIVLTLQARTRTFSNVESVTLRVFDRAGNEICCCPFGGGGFTALVTARIHRHNAGWRIHSIGTPGSGRTLESLFPLIKACC